MIKAGVFDLDGTLVQTERLKALSYAQAAIKLCPYDVNPHEVIEAFKEVVGRSRREVAISLMVRFDLTERAEALQRELGVSSAWQAFVQVRLGIYERMISDPGILRDNQWPYTVGLLQSLRDRDCRTALATMSGRERTREILQILDLADAFDFVATRDDVDKGKPDPEIYLLVAHEIALEPADCLVIEDSPVGVEAALRAGMHCVAVATPFTQTQLHASGLLEDRWIVDDPVDVIRIVDQRIEEIDQHG